jgi:NAD(P)-dependent dehydrogenase (short-subunit alcohol dehydrogenase family)
MSSDSKTMLIVGAGDFIGSAIARRFAAGGYTVCMGRRNGDKLDALVAELKAAGSKAHAFSMDARKEEDVVGLFANIESEIGPLDCVIFNAGANVNFSLGETTTRVFHKVWEMACFAGFLTAREAAKYMCERERGSIFFTGATASVRGGSGYAAFASAKFGLRGLAQATARELGVKNIHVAHLVIDAGVDTAFVRELIEKASGTPASELPPDTLMDPASIADTYWMLHNQSRDAWTFELDLRPYAERW